jgi:hypothetical protein
MPSTHDGPRGRNAHAVRSVGFYRVGKIAFEANVNGFVTVRDFAHPKPAKPEPK